MSEQRVPYLPTLATKAGEASAELTAEQLAARTASWQSITAMLAAVRVQLGDHPLKGMENLSTSTMPYRACQIRRKRPWEPLSQPPRAETDPHVHGDPALVLDSTVQLMVARRNALGEVDARPAAPEDLLSEDAADVAEVLVYALRRHLVETGNGKERYRKLRRLAERLERALGEP